MEKLNIANRIKFILEAGRFLFKVWITGLPEPVQLLNISGEIPNNQGLNIKSGAPTKNLALIYKEQDKKIAFGDHAGLISPRPQSMKNSQTLFQFISQMLHQLIALFLVSFQSKEAVNSDSTIDVDVLFITTQEQTDLVDQYIKPKILQILTPEIYHSSLKKIHAPSIRITSIKTIPQNLAAIFMHTTDENGKLLPHFRDSRIVGLDSGCQTFLYSEVVNFHGRDIGQDEQLGLNSVSSETLSESFKLYGIPMKVGELMHRIYHKNLLVYSRKHRNKLVDLGEIFDSHVEDWKKQVMSVLADYLQTKNPNHIFGSGNGIAYLKDTLRKKYPQFEVIPDHGIANIKGAIKYVNMGAVK